MNNNENKLFTKIGGYCPYCKGNINIIEGLVYDYCLDNEGMPYFLHSEDYKVVGYCTHCKKALYAIPNKSGGYTVYPDNDAIPMIIHKLSMNNISRSSLLGMKLMEDIDVNPFINVKL